MNPLLLLYVVSAVAGLAAATAMARSPRLHRLDRVYASGGLLVTFVAGTAGAATGTRGGVLTSIAWLLLGWTLGTFVERRRS
jgi:hypothetical protein